MADPILIAKDTEEIHLLPRMANRHGLIAGATGTGKSVTLRVMAESFSKLGIPVFMADVKGDLAGMCRAGGDNPKVAERAQQFGLTDFAYTPFPVMFWDVFGEQGHPLRSTISEMGPLLLGRVLNLNDTQSGVLSLVFKVADDNGWLLLDLKDLRAMLQFVAENAKSLTTSYGNVSSASVGAIQRRLLELEQQGGDKFFGEPSLNMDDMRQTDEQGRGLINILAADKLMQAPKLYGTFLLWMLSELFEQLPEVGDIVKPKMVFFFDEAHLLFSDAPDVLLQKIEQVVRLIRSKGVGVYFVSQNPLDIPDIVLGQLGNRVQHALRAFTPRDQKAVKAAATTFRANPALDTEAAITELGVGEALVSLLDDKGTPGIVRRALVAPPHSRLGAITPDERRATIQSSLIAGHYEAAVDRESAYEMLKQRREQAEQQLQQQQVEEAPPSPVMKEAGDILGAFATSAARAVGSSLGRQIIRGVMGSIFGGGGRRR
ncbi:MAG: helicase HerA-like domain-containing protein [Blastocatellia bacterium]|nr:helicase HerA-like domain-containing protein [Blastocatellia bacterium]